jgi:4-amino-4-deoxy-L-arabinose transferase-like glycosyltransferase
MPAPDTHAPRSIAAVAAPVEFRSAGMLRSAILWGTAFSLFCWLVRAYALRDADSILYEAIARSLESRPVAEWIAPLWPAGWATGNGLFVEHLACFFWPAALLGKLGLRGALAANFLWVLIAFALLFRLSRALCGLEAGWLSVLFYAVSPAGIEYLVRANHEPALGCAYLGALWCLAEERARPWALAGFVLLAVAIKGALGLLIFPAALAGWLLHRRSADLRGLFLGAVLVATFGAAYELCFQRATGASFFAAYLDSQLSQVAENQQLGLLHLLFNPVYYAGSALWFGLPGAPLVALEIATRRRWPSRARRAVLSPAVAFLSVLSLMARRAVRYAFPAFCLFNVAGAQVLLERLPAAKRWIGTHHRLLEPALAGLLLALAGVRVAM